ncbi:MAG: hypothetical protein BWZ10_01712 [candidate division BRC1 bacterium ADurb.BinA364]|nr:MAG: hypothetical protein BWZ10_01712 [candidate division BRC1 bacterium ADurb.BinA364]
MVRGLVDQQAAAVLLVAVPAAEIIRSMALVEHPFEHDRTDLADRSVLDQLLGFAANGRIAVVEGDDDPPPGPLFRVEDALAFLGVDRHRFFGDGVATALHGPHDVFVVVAVHGGDDHPIGLLLVDHAVEVLGLVGGDRPAELFGEAFVAVIHPGLVAIAQADEFAGVAKLIGDGLCVHARTAAQADLHVTFFAGRHIRHDDNSFPSLRVRRESAASAIGNV